MAQWLLISFTSSRFPARIPVPPIKFSFEFSQAQHLVASATGPIPITRRAMGARFSQESDPSTQEWRQKPSGPEWSRRAQGFPRECQRERENQESRNCIIFMHPQKVILCECTKTLYGSAKSLFEYTKTYPLWMHEDLLIFAHLRRVILSVFTKTLCGFVKGLCAFTNTLHAFTKTRLFAHPFRFT